MTDRKIKSDGNIDIEPSGSNITNVESDLNVNGTVDVTGSLNVDTNLDVTGTINNYYLPGVDGSNGQVLATDSNGNLSWQTVSSSSSGSGDNVHTFTSQVDLASYTHSEGNIIFLDDFEFDFSSTGLNQDISKATIYVNLAGTTGQALTSKFKNLTDCEVYLIGVDSSDIVYFEKTTNCKIALYNSSSSIVRFNLGSTASSDILNTEIKGNSLEIYNGGNDIIYNSSEIVCDYFYIDEIACSLNKTKLITKEFLNNSLANDSLNISNFSHLETSVWLNNDRCLVSDSYIKVTNLQYYAPTDTTARSEFYNNADCPLTELYINNTASYAVIPQYAGNDPEIFEFKNNHSYFDKFIFVYNNESFEVINGENYLFYFDTNTTITTTEKFVNNKIILATNGLDRIILDAEFYDCDINNALAYNIFILRGTYRFCNIKSQGIYVTNASIYNSKINTNGDIYFYAGTVTSTDLKIGGMFFARTNYTFPYDSSFTLSNININNVNIQANDLTLNQGSTYHIALNNVESFTENINLTCATANELIFTDSLIKYTRNETISGETNISVTRTTFGNEGSKKYVSSGDYSDNELDTSGSGRAQIWLDANTGARVWSSTSVVGYGVCAITTAARARFSDSLFDSTYFSISTDTTSVSSTNNYIQTNFNGYVRITYSISNAATNIPANIASSDFSYDVIIGRDRGGTNTNIDDSLTRSGIGKSSGITQQFSVDNGANFITTYIGLGDCVYRTCIIQVQNGDKYYLVRNTLVNGTYTLLKNPLLEITRL